MRPTEVYDALATLLTYPDEGFAPRARTSGAALAEHAPDLATLLAPFLDRASAEPVTSWEELYTRTFDWAPERALEIGWHLFGEQYDRGAFLVRLRERLRAAGVEEGSELPDHLGTVLRLLPRLPPAEGDRMAAEAVAPALARIEAGFTDEPNAYRDVLRAVVALLPPAPLPSPTPAGGP